MRDNKNQAVADSILTEPCAVSGRQTWVEVDLQAVVQNYRALAALVTPDSKHTGPFPIRRPRVIPVVKTNAYGHGAVPVARALALAGATILAVGVAEEAIELRQAGISCDILVLGTAWTGLEEDAVRNRLILAVDAPESVCRLERAANDLKSSIPVHVKVDTGMGRLGIRWDSVEPLLAAVRQARRVRFAGTFSHLSSADEPDPAYTLDQVRKFEHSLSAVREAGFDPGEIHLANSAGILFHERMRHWSVRPGIALYGYPPTISRHSPVELCPALTLKTRVATIRWLEPGEPLGYNRRFTASRATRVATLPVGYADGYGRRLEGRGKVIVRDSWAPVIGAVSMDMISVDLTDLPEVETGDEVILLGASARCRMGAEQWADLIDTVHYEVLCGIAARIPRRYFEIRPHESLASNEGRG